MIAQQHYWDVFWAWSLGLGFLLIIVLIGVCCYFLGQGYISLPFSQERRTHKRKMELMRLRQEFIRQGTDPDYIKLMEQKIDRELGN